ncbi:hypothetical protein NL64_28445 [Pseudomonas fluorescens]|uniref:flavodoxin domain-containing protein n=1 Tax=Pseudomonas fluorescens TaxID=294 RepID=UPI00054BBA95|nr:flavodoxin domain-containing protein [Pseudomonas fluorescens]KII27300.1 hypothetical protein NL64_28445 [Pseudomonas fluorescens]
MIIVCNSFGDGDPPGNADRFLDRLNQHECLSGQPYAIFGLGDTAYPTFCGFTKSLDAALLQKKSSPWINPVDADTDFDGFFDVWCVTLATVLKGDRHAEQAAPCTCKSPPMPKTPRGPRGSSHAPD